MYKKWKSLRLKGYDYSSAGAYFLTICTYNRRCSFGTIIDSKVILTNAGLIADDCWKKIPDHFPNTEAGSYIIMPNHIHGILYIHDKFFQTQSPKILKRSLLSIIIGSYKAAVTKAVRENGIDRGFKWQRYYYDHIVRSEKALLCIHDYMLLNPTNWHEDMENWDYLKTISEKERHIKLDNFYKRLAVGRRAFTPPTKA